MRTNVLKPIQCPNCLESNEKQARFCTSCKMILKYDVYTENLEQQGKKQEEIQALKQSFNKEMIKVKEQIIKDVKKEVAELLIRLKPEIINEAFSK
jgi:hypothetical protein